MRKLAFALFFVCGAAVAETPANAPPAQPPVTPGNPNNASNPEGPPVPPKKWEMRDDQQVHRGECKRLTKQIARYDRDAGWAQERGNELWELSSRERVYRPAAERQRLCPSKRGPTTEELLAYRWVLERLEELAGKQFATIHIIGGGTKNRLLNQFTANATNRVVVTGPVEATAIGNVLMQAIGLGHLGSLAEARSIVRTCFEVQEYHPAPEDGWEAAYSKLLTLLEKPGIEK